MLRAEVLLSAGVVVVVGLYAGLAGAWTGRDPGWYAALPKPAWQPPDLVFGVMWPYNFVALLVAGLVIALTRPTGTALPVLAVLTGCAAFSLGWAYLFYVPHALAGAAASLAVAAVLGWVLVVLASRTTPWTGVVLVPFALWLTVATALAVAYARA